MGPSLLGLAVPQDVSPNGFGGERKRDKASLTTDEEDRQIWQVIQKATSRDVDRLPKIRKCHECLQYAMTHR